MKKWFLILCLAVFTLTASAQNKYGRYIINGSTVQVTDEILTAFIDWANQNQQEYKPYFAEIVDALRNGEDVEVNTLRQTCNVIPSYLNEREKERLTQQPRASESKNLKNTRHAIALLSNFKLVKQEKPIEIKSDNLDNIIRSYITNAVNEIKNKKFDTAANSFNNAIAVIFNEKSRFDNDNSFLNAYQKELLVLTYDRLWCLIVYLEEMVASGVQFTNEELADFLKDTVSELNFLSSSLENNSNIVQGHFTIEDVYTMSGSLKYLLGIDYTEDLNNGGNKGRNFLNRIKAAQSYGADYYTKIEPFFSTSIQQRITQ